MIRLSQLRVPPSPGTPDLRAAAAAYLKLPQEEIQGLRILRRSLDARRKEDIHWSYTLALSLPPRQEAKLLRRDRSGRLSPWEERPYIPPRRRGPWEGPPPVVAGFGPAGMFAALALAEAGLRPIVLERGQDVGARTAAVRRFWAGGPLEEENNVQFGEGGAGAFSDGKLNTGVNDPRIPWILQRLWEFGAPEDIRWEARPHVGTDILAAVVCALRRRIAALGGEVRFGHRLESLSQKDGALHAVTVSQGGTAYTLPCRRLILALGHSARDTMEALFALGLPMEAKAFSLGARLEHPQALVDLAQYGRPRGDTLPPADYRLNCRLPGGGGVYTFCMCPGGQVVAAASERDGVVTNGMSLHARDGANANSALLVGVTPADFPFPGPLGGMYWQREIEQRAFRLGGGDYRAPAQRVEDFLARRPGAGPGAVPPTYAPGVAWGDLWAVLPERVAAGMAWSLPELGKKLRGFDLPDAVLTGPETRSSSPVRLLRGQDFQSPGLPGLYPCGEGAGYAGGITSAAADGLRCAEALIGAS